MKEKQPKLIVLNGPLGIGKITLARLYAQQHEHAIAIDIDTIRADIDHWREQPQESARQSWEIALQMGKVALADGKDVCISQIITKAEQWRLLVRFTKETDARLVEVLLYAPKDEAIKRFIKRGQSAGFSNGYRPGGLIDRGGGIAKVERMYDTMLQLAQSRQGTIIIESIEGNMDDTLARVART